jgi:hypothetical protein
LTQRLVVYDVVVLSLIEVPWLAVPAYLELIQVPYSEVAATSLPLMAVVLSCAFLWSFVVRGRFVSRTDPPSKSIQGRIAFFAFMGYFWSLIDDGPVNFDSVSTWPEVTSGFQHILLEVILHVLTASFFYLSVREALKGEKIASLRKTFQVFLLTLAALWAAYFQNTPLEIVQVVARNGWYPLDFLEHAVSVALFYFAIRTSASPKPGLSEIES